MNKVWSPRPGLTHNGLVPGEKKVWLTLQTPVINTQIKALIVQRDVCVKMCVFKKKSINWEKANQDSTASFATYCTVCTWKEKGNQFSIFSIDSYKLDDMLRKQHSLCSIAFKPSQCFQKGNFLFFPLILESQALRSRGLWFLSGWPEGPCVTYLYHAHYLPPSLPWLSE